MIIEIVKNEEQVVEKIKFDDLEPGIVFQIDGEYGELGAIALKLEEDKYVMLTYSSGNDWFVLGDGSMVEDCEITKVYGKLVGLKAQYD